MSQPLEVLLVEDSENDALLLELELQRAGYEPHCRRVDTAEGLEQALSQQLWELVIADYKMPRFDGLAALALVKGRGLDLPFIIVSGQITDKTAVEAMRAGAHDYVMKDNLTRLGSAVQRELRDATVRQQHRQAEQQAKVEQSFRQAIEHSVPCGISVVDLKGCQTHVNPAFCAMVGWSEAELLGAGPPFVYWPAEEVEAIGASLAQVAQGQSVPGGLELNFRRRSGERLSVLVQSTPLRDSLGKLTGWVSSSSDITERKRAEERLAAEHAVTRVLATSGSLEQAGPGLLQALLEGLDADLGILWLLVPAMKSLQPFVLRARSSAPALQSFLQSSQRLSFAVGSALPGRVWTEGRAVWMSPLSAEAAFLRQEPAHQAGLLSAMAFPLQNGPDFFGVLEFFCRRRLQQDPALLNMMGAIGSEIGQFLRRRHAEEALRRAHEELELRVQERTAQLKAANTSLEAAIQARQRLEQELLDITENERRRIGLDLHDDLGQKLSGIALMTKGLELKLTRQRVEEAQDAARIHNLVQEAMNHASDLARDLATLDMAEKNLPTALADLANHARDSLGIGCRFKSQGSMPTLSPTLVRQLYKIAQEALTNAIKHGKAKRIAIGLSRRRAGLLLSVRNDGVPFPDLEDRPAGMGLRIMHYRASLIGAELDIHCDGSQGTVVSCALSL